MGFSVSASTAIIFAGLFLAAGILYPAMNNGMERVQDAQVDRDDAQLDLRNTEITIDSVSGSTTVEVNNTGSTSLTASEVDLVIDERYINRDEISRSIGTDNVPDDTDLWLPGETLTLDTDGTENGARVTVITEHGIRDSEAT